MFLGGYRVCLHVEDNREERRIQLRGRAVGAHHRKEAGRPGVPRGAARCAVGERPSQEQARPSRNPRPQATRPTRLSNPRDAPSAGHLPPLRQQPPQRPAHHERRRRLAARHPTRPHCRHRRSQELSKRPPSEAARSQLFRDAGATVDGGILALLVCLLLFVRSHP